MDQRSVSCGAEVATPLLLKIMERERRSFTVKRYSLQYNTYAGLPITHPNRSGNVQSSNFERSINHKKAYKNLVTIVGLVLARSVITQEF